MLAVAIEGTTYRDPRILPGAFLWMTGMGTVLLVNDSLNSQSAAKSLGEFAVAATLLVMCVRIWRANEGSGWVALLFTLLHGLRYSVYGWPPFDGVISWFDLVYAIALLEISVGLWRAHQWARRAAG